MKAHISTSNEPPITILIADDHPLMRQGIRMALAVEKNLSVIGEEALQCIAFRNPDVVVLDLDMPKRDGLSAVRELNRINLPVGVIILTPAHRSRPSLWNARSRCTRIHP